MSGDKIFKSKRMLQIGWISAVMVVVFLLFKLDDFLSNIKPSIAQIKALHGTVDMRTEDDIVWSRVKTGSALANQDLLATSDSSSAEIQFNDGRVIQVGPNSQIVLATEQSKGKGSNVIRLLRGQVIATNTDRPKTKKWNPLNKESKTPLLIATKANEIFQLNSSNASLTLNRDVESGVTNILQLSGQVQRKQKNEKAFMPLPNVAPTFIDKPVAAEPTRLQSMALASDTSFAHAVIQANDPTSIVKESTDADKKPRSSLAPSIATRKPKSKPVTPIVPRFKFPADPPQLALLSSGSPIPIFPKPSSIEDLPSPSIAELTGTKICTFDSFQMPTELAPLNIKLNSTLTQAQADRNKDAKFMIQVSALVDRAKAESTLVGFPIKFGPTVTTIDVSKLLENPISNPAGMFKVPLIVETWTSTDSQTDQRPLDAKVVKIDLCSFGNLKSQPYRIFVNNIPSGVDSESKWFPWSKPSGGKTNYVISVASSEILLKLRSILSSTRTFAIESREFDTVSKSIFFLKRGKIIASLRGSSPQRSAIDTLAKVLESDLVFFGEGESYTPLEDSVDSRLSSINRVLRENNVVYLLIKGRIVPIKFEDVKMNAVLVRSYLLTTDGVFLKQPKVL